MGVLVVCGGCWWWMLTLFVVAAVFLFSCIFDVCFFSVAMANALWANARARKGTTA